MSDHEQRMADDPVYAWIEFHYGEPIKHGLTDAPLRKLIDESLRAAVAERDKWRAWKPDDEDLAVLKEQAMNRNGDHKGSLAACVVYIGALEARLREHESNQEIAPEGGWEFNAFLEQRNNERDAAIARAVADTIEMCATTIERCDYLSVGERRVFAAAIRARGEGKE